MTTTALLLLSISAFAHAFWNFIGKRSSPSAAFFLMASISALACLLPVLLAFADLLPHIPGGIWLWVLATGACQAVYYVGLAGAYRSGDLSVAYPLARALPALMIVAVSTMLGLAKPVSPMGSVGIAAVAAGCLLVPLKRPGDLRLRTYLNRCCAMAVVAAVGTTGYTLIDSEMLRRLRALPEIHLGTVELSLLYMGLETAAIVLALGLVVLVSGEQRARLGVIRREGWKQAAVTGIIITATYGLVLAAMGYVSNVGYLAAFRQLSIPLGAMMGVLIQKESAPLPKILGIGIILLGLVMIALT